MTALDAVAAIATDAFDEDPRVRNGRRQRPKGWRPQDTVSSLFRSRFESLNDRPSNAVTTIATDAL